MQQLIIGVPFSDMNSFVMDYLVSMGYPASAAKFAKEAKVHPRVDIDTIKERVEIRDLIFKEDILTAIEKINDVNPQVSADTPQATQYAHLHKTHLLL